MEKAKSLMRVLAGSRMYGTNTENSDYDYKEIVLYSLDDILAGTRLVNTRSRPIGVGSNDKMPVGGEETEYIPLQVFMNDFFAGQTYAVELAFSIAAGNYERSYAGTEDFRDDLTSAWIANSVVKVMVERFLNDSVSPMVGYAINQSQMYGLKTQRYTAVKKIIDEINGFFDSEDKQRTTLAKDAPELFQNILKLDFVKVVEHVNSQGLKSDMLEVSEKLFPLNRSWFDVKATLEKMISTYGNRVKNFEGQPADWKSIAHAIRITEQVVELSKANKITLPRPNAEELKNIRLGRVPLQMVTDRLQQTFDELEVILPNSVLRKKSIELENEFRAWKIAVLKSIYLGAFQ